MKMELGKAYMTKWDDSKKLLRAFVFKTWRGHREQKALVELEDGSTQEMCASQAIREARK